ncbi:MAG: leucyl/phenylalanyl-tRNA--protein transferase [Prevotellaceae bacterium]|jgi:leucyl/phenylalanyl-tRNA--protein transferase|nr:leucyl/phenylalanyl-tRNA--protein transferase [Prevotellaceae bacterium]
MPVYLLNEELVFPHPSLADDEGLLAIGGDLSLERLLQAYANGIFPWYSEDDPIMWWSPNPRCILYPDKLIVSDSLRRKIKKGVFEVRFDANFAAVISACANAERPAQDGTWITREIQEAYIGLHRLGFAHSVETYKDKELAGGLYGVSIGNAFFGESMFHTVSDASKVAFVHLVERVKSWKFSFIDNQQVTSHLLSLGAEAIPRDVFLKLLQESVNLPTHRGVWSL